MATTSVNPAKYVARTNKSQDFLIIEYNISTSVNATTNSAIFSLNMPDLVYGIDYAMVIKELRINTGVNPFNVTICNEEENFASGLYSLQVINNNLNYHEANLNLFYGDLDNGSTRGILLQIYNGSGSTITSIPVRVALEVLYKKF